ncbi:hypothetical protein UFOVP592_10 [uncultured Caudovirales phage]|uniref:Uncharacterized protein n=1 Tax=uncultured Caudovirales phage TaxID=2100421 RepID=A0A6J5N234_9CAUD|nr:hypothetical protein UFOVP592_10 [uncultured Caudovirales phage]
MATLSINVSFFVEVEVDDSALEHDTLIIQATEKVYNTIGVNFRGVRMLSIDPATLKIGADIYDLDM